MALTSPATLASEPNTNVISTTNGPAYSLTPSEPPTLSASSNASPPQPPLDSPEKPSHVPPLSPTSTSNHSDITEAVPLTHPASPQEHNDDDSSSHNHLTPSTSASSNSENIPESVQHPSSASAKSSSAIVKSKKQIKPKSLNSLFLKVQASSSSTAAPGNTFSAQPKSQVRSESPSVSKPSPVGSYASLASSKGGRSQITSMSTATGAFKLATTMRREGSPFQKSSSSSPAGTTGSPHSEVATVWRRTDETANAAAPPKPASSSPPPSSGGYNNDQHNQSAHPPSNGDQEQSQHPHKIVTFDASVKDTQSSSTSNEPKNTSDDDEPTEEELLRQGIHLARRLSTDAPRREFNWDEDDDISWSELAKTAFPEFSEDKSNKSTTSNDAPAATSSSSYTKKYEPPHKAHSTPSTTGTTWKIPQTSSNFTPISKQFQELSEQRNQQQQNHYNNSQRTGSYLNWNNNNPHGGPDNHQPQFHNDGGSHKVDNRYRYSDYEKRYRSDNSSKPELFNEHNGQVEAFIHRSRANGPPMGGRGSAVSPSRSGPGSENALETYERRHSAFSGQDNANLPLPSQARTSQSPEYGGSYRRNSSPRRYQVPHHDSVSSNTRPKPGILEKQEEVMRLARENAIKRKEEEARLEREREEITRRKVEERLAKLEERKLQEQKEAQAKQQKEEEERKKQEAQQPPVSLVQTPAQQPYARNGSQSRSGGLTQPKTRRGGSFNHEDNPALRAVSSLIGEDHGDRLRTGHQKIWIDKNENLGKSKNISPNSNSGNVNNSPSYIGHDPNDSHMNPGMSVETQDGANFWMSMHTPRPSEGDVWGTFAPNHHPNLYPKQNSVQQEFPAPSLPTSSPASSTHSHNMMSSWGVGNGGPSEHHPYDAPHYMGVGPDVSGHIISPDGVHSWAPHPPAQHQQPQPQPQPQQSQQSQSNSHSAQRSASLPNSPMASMHPHTQGSQHSVSETPSTNSSTSKLVPRMALESQTMSRGFSRFFPTVGNDDHHQQHSPVESMAAIASPNAGIPNTPSAVNVSSVHHAVIHSPASDVSTAPNGISSGMTYRSSSITPPRSIRGSGSFNTGNGPLTPTGPPSAFVPKSLGVAPSIPENVIISSGEDLSYLSELNFSPSSSYLPNVGNIVVPTRHIRTQSYTMSGDESVFADIAPSVGNPRVSLPPRSAAEAALQDVHHRSQHPQTLSSLSSPSQPQFKTTPSINSIQALQSTIAEKLGSTNSLKNGSATKSSALSSALRAHQQRTNAPRDLPIPVSPIVLSENIPPFNSSGSKRASIFETVFTPQATNQDEMYTPVSKNLNSAKFNTASYVPTGHSLDPAATSEQLMRKHQSFAESVGISFGADRQLPLPAGAAIPTAPAILSTAAQTANGFQTPPQQELSAFDPASHIEVIDHFSSAPLHDEPAGTELDPQSYLGKFEEAFNEYVDELDGSSISGESGKKVPIVAMPYYTSANYNSEVSKQYELDIPKDWDKGLVVPKDQFLCTLFFWSEGQATAYNREFKPRVNSRVSLLIPGNSNKILTQYRVGNPATYISTGATSLDELLEGKTPPAGTAATSPGLSVITPKSGRASGGSSRRRGSAAAATAAAVDGDVLTSMPSGPKMGSKRSASTSLSGPPGRPLRRSSSQFGRRGGPGSGSTSSGSSSSSSGGGSRPSSARNGRGSSSAAVSSTIATKVRS